MRKKEIFLDFTSLLDVTLIVIFFFVMFSNLDAQENKKKTEAKIDELDSSIQMAIDRESEANELIEQLEKELNIVADGNERYGANLKELINFTRSENIKIYLVTENNKWKARVIAKNNMVAVIDITSDCALELEKAVKQADYKSEDTIFCDLIFDGSHAGSALAYRRITNGLDKLSGVYEHLYISETDLSTGEE